MIVVSSNTAHPSYALRRGLYIHSEPWDRKTIRYTDGSYDKTVGIVDTHWTFESGSTIPVTFDVVEDCIQDIVLGEEIAYDVYATQPESIAQVFVDDGSWPLAPFSFVNKWQEILRNFHLFPKGTSKFPRARMLSDPSKGR